MRRKLRKPFASQLKRKAARSTSSRSQSRRYGNSREGTHISFNMFVGRYSTCGYKLSSWEGSLHLSRLTISPENWTRTFSRVDGPEPPTDSVNCYGSLRTYQTVTANSPSRK